MKRLDEMDRRILFELQTNARASNQEIADRVGLSPTPCLRRIRQLEESGYVTGYTAVLSQEALGLAMTAFVRLTLDRQSVASAASVEEEIRAIPEVVEAHLLAGDHDFLLKIVTPSLKTYEALLRHRLRSLPSLASIETSFAIGVVKEPSPLPLD